MAFRLEEDLLDLKEPPICFLDMKGLKIRTEEELQFAIKRVPDLKLRKEKIIDEEVQPPPPPVLKKKTGFNNTPIPGGGGSEKKGDASGPGVYDFENPIPDGMRAIKLRDVAQVEIDWKMLTLDRPKTQLDEEIYSRFVELDRLKLKTMASEAPWVLYGNRPAVTLLPVSAPGHKKKKKRKGHKKSKGGGSDSDDEDDDNAVDDDLVALDYEEDEDNPTTIPTAVFNDKFTYEHYARFVEDKDENDDADLAEETQEVPIKKEKPVSKGIRRKRSAKKKDVITPKEQEVKTPLIPITVNPPSPVPPKNTLTKKKTKSKSSDVKNSVDKGTKIAEKKRVKSKVSDSGEVRKKVKPKTKTNSTSITKDKLEVKEIKRPITPTDDKKSKSKSSSSKSKKKTK